MLQPVILAGGSGTRLWPISREERPKQFLSFFGGRSMLEETVLRLEGLRASAPLVVCNDAHRFLAAEQLRGLGGGGTVMLEPVGRNTAPAILLAAMRARAEGGDPLLLVLAADHAMADPGAFRAAVRLALPQAEAGRLVTFGIVPDRPETGYGYIRRGPTVGDGAFQVAAFVEKPDRVTAEGYLAGGEHFWNSGMFLFRASALIEETGRHAPEMVAACERAFAASREDADFLRIDAESFAACPAKSIDYAVMEKTTQAVMVPLDAGWSDIGSFAALWALREKDADGNALSGDVVAVASRNSLVEARSRLVALVGVEDLVVVETGDAVLVARRDRVQEIEAAVRQMKEAGRPEILRAGGE